METHINFLKDLSNLVDNNQDATLVAIDQNGKSIVITANQGEINYISYDNKKNESAIDLLENLIIVEHSLKKYIKFSSKEANLPPSEDIIKRLTSSLPQSLEYDPKQISSPEVNSVADDKKFSPIQPQLSPIPEDTLQIVSSCLVQSLGPISTIIYEDAVSQFPSVTTRTDLANLLNFILEEIEDEEIEYQQQFLTSIAEKLGNIVSVPTSM